MKSRTRFEKLVLRALDRIPPEFRERLDNVDLIVQRRPSPRQLRYAGVPPGATLLGLYVGTPLPHRGSGYTMTLPDRIYLFQEPIEQVAESSREVVRQVRVTVLHELAHHFGISDQRLDQLGVE